MIEFRMLGTLNLTGAGGRELRVPLAQPRRLALLAYLAAATPRGFHRRDSLLALFWPELDPAIAGGQLSEALDLYRGDLLEGFFITGALAFERWLEGERSRLRETAGRSAHALVEQCEASGDVSVAAHWARRALRLAPLDERSLRRLIKLLDQLGDRASAVQVYDEFATRLAAEVDAQPAAETQALLAAVRARGTAAAPVALRSDAPAISIAHRHTVGRTRERAALLASFESAAAGHGQVVCVAGEPG